MFEGKPTNEWKTAKDILSYFLRNPKAADTLEGVARMRLVDEIVHRSTSETDRALKWLVSRGYMVEELIPGKAALFRLNPAQEADALRLLAQSKTQRGESYEE